MEETEVSGTQRSEPEVDAARKAAVSQWGQRLTAAKTYWKDDFDRMREDMHLAKYGCSKEWKKSGSFVVPIINRHINQAVSQLYAKNPTATATRRKRLMASVWDGKGETLQAAIDVAMSGMASLQDMAVLQDAIAVKQYNDQLDRIGETLEILYDYFSKEQKPVFKRSMKAFVRRAKTTGVAYAQLGFQRQYAELSLDEVAVLSDARERMAEIERRAADAIDGATKENDPEIDELRTSIAGLEQQQNTILREGPVDMFPRSTEIIIDPACTDLNGFKGAGWIAREFHKTSKEVQKIYGVDVGDGYKGYSQEGKGDLAQYHASADTSGERVADEDVPGLVCVWQIWDKELGQELVIADGYHDYLKAPAAPDIEVEGFWSVMAFTLNDAEDEEGSIFPQSDVRALMHTQNEYNRSREYRRLHREANKPKYFVSQGRLEEEDKAKLESHPPHAVIELQGLMSGQKVDDVIQPGKSVPIDPALYETNSEMEDVLRIVGSQEANLGGTGGGSATESSIAENSRMTTVSSNVDDLDDFLTEFARNKGQIMLSQMSEQTVKEIVGPGAIWPTMNASQIAKEIGLEVAAGSSGRPNQASDLANLERAMPFLLQLPGMNPMVIGRKYASLLELDPDEMMLDGIPSIQALNSMFGKMAAPTNTNPAEQGGQGGDNAAQPPGTAQGAQPAMPSGDEAGIGEAVY